MAFDMHLDEIVIDNPLWSANRNHRLNWRGGPLLDPVITSLRALLTTRFRPVYTAH